MFDLLFYKVVVGRHIRVVHVSRQLLQARLGLVLSQRKSLNA
jgi:hypothetical protein